MKDIKAVLIGLHSNQPNKSLVIAISTNKIVKIIKRYTHMVHYMSDLYFCDYFIGENNIQFFRVSPILKENNNYIEIFNSMCRDVSKVSVKLIQSHRYPLSTCDDVCYIA